MNLFALYHSNKGSFIGKHIKYIDSSLLSKVSDFPEETG